MGNGLAGPDALHRGRVRDVRPGLAPRGAPGRPLGPARDDDHLLPGARRGRPGGGGGPAALAARGRAHPDGGLRLDLSPGRHPDDRAALDAPGLHHRPQRAGGQPGHRGRGGPDRLPGPAGGLAHGLRGALPPRHRVRRRLRPRGPARGDGARQEAQAPGGAAARADGADLPRDVAGRGVEQHDLQLHHQREQPAPGRAAARPGGQPGHPRRPARGGLRDRLPRPDRGGEADRSLPAQVRLPAHRGRAGPALRPGRALGGLGAVRPHARSSWWSCSAPSRSSTP